jgi:hypothetical protein
MKKIVLCLFIVLPAIANANTQHLDASIQSQQATVALVNVSKNTSLSVEHSQIANSMQEASLIEGNATLLPNISSNDLQNTVPLPVAAPLLALAIALFGFGANRRRV